MSSHPCLFYFCPTWLWHRALLCLLACCGWLTALADTPAPPAVLAVLYSRADAAITQEFERIVADIEQVSDVVVYRVALNPPKPMNVDLKPQGGIAVIYPDIGEPYRGIFLKIIQGIEERTRTRVASYAVDAAADVPALAAELRRQDVRMVIALGRNGLKVASSLGQRDIGVVAGGVVNAPDADTQGIRVHSLAPDPQLLFEQLKSIMPTAKRVFVVYDPRQNGWLVRLAQDAAKKQALELVAHEATDLKSATRLYQEFFASADARKDALWLPQDSTTIEESSVLPMILQESWNRTVVVFSSNVAHVRRGALFSLYPNNVELGRNLATSALGLIATGNAVATPTAAVIPLKSVLVAVNVRTAHHLGLDARQQNYDMVFPEP